MNVAKQQQEYGNALFNLNFIRDGFWLQCFYNNSYSPN